MLIDFSKVTVSIDLIGSVHQLQNRILKIKFLSGLIILLKKDRKKISSKSEIKPLYIFHVDNKYIGFLYLVLEYSEPYTESILVPNFIMEWQQLNEICRMLTKYSTCMFHKYYYPKNTLQSTELETYLNRQADLVS